MAALTTARTDSFELLEDYFRFWKVVVHRVAVIKFRMNNRCGNSTGSFEVKIGAYTAKFTNMIISRFSRAGFSWREGRGQACLGVTRWETVKAL